MKSEKIRVRSEELRRMKVQNRKEKRWNNKDFC